MTGQGATWDVAVDRTALQAWSLTRLPFEPRGELLAYRTALRAALRQLSASADTGHGLIATYGAPNREFVDVENAALYNVGAGSYSHLASQGIVCRRVDSPDDRHHLTYTVGDLTDPDPTARQLLAQVMQPLPIPPGTTRPTEWWRLFSGQFTTMGVPHERGDFVLDVTLTGTWTGPGVAAATKSLLDGMICALHHHDGTTGDQIRTRLAAYGDTEALWSRLNDPASSIFGQRRLVHCHGEGVAWNPADERCTAFRIRVLPRSQRSVTVQVRTHGA